MMTTSIMSNDLDILILLSSIPLGLYMFWIMGLDYGSDMALDM